MFDVGFTEIVLIGIVSLIVIGPERLPAVARTAGQWIGKVQRFVRGVKTDLASELESGDLKKLIGDQREQINELKDMVHSAKKDFQSTTKQAVDHAKQGLKELETTVKDADDVSASDTSNVPEKNVASTNLSKNTTQAGQSGKGVSPESPTQDAPTAKTGGDVANAANSDSGSVGGMDRTGTDTGN